MATSGRAGLGLRLGFGCAAAGVAVIAINFLTGFDAGLSPGFLQGLYVAVYLLPAGLLIMRGARVSAERAAWLLIGFGAVGSAAGWAVYFLFLQDLEAPPYPSPADALWLSFYAASFVALVLLLRDRVAKLGRAIWIDALLGALTLAAIGAALLLDPILASTGGSTAAVATNLAYPMLDVLVLSVVLVVFAVSGWRPGLRWWLIGGAWALQAVVDTIYLYKAASGTYAPGTLLDLPWIAIVLTLAYAAWRRPDEQVEPELDGWRVLVVPLLFAAVALGLSTLDSFQHVNDLAVVLATATLLLAVVRAALTFADLRSVAHGRELQSRHERILNSAGEGIYGVDREGRISFANVATATMTGRDQVTLVGVDHDVLLQAAPDGSTDALGSSPVIGSLADGSAQRTEALYVRSDGTTFPVEYTSTPIVDDDEVTGAVVVFKDISERLEVDRLKDEFTSVVSHELRTPLTSIRGSLGLLAGGAFGPLPERGQRMAEIAVENTDRLVRLINDILDIERIDSGRVAMQRTACEASELVARAVELMRPMATEAGVGIASSVATVPLHADPDRVLQTLTNLLSNAIKFSEPSGAVDIGCELRDGSALFTVRDRGRGIPADKLDEIFERFGQVDASDSRQKGGTGLGLPICRSIVGYHGGRIWVDSEPGEGSTFHFTLPAAARAQPARAEQDSGAPTVLICDDDANVLEVVSAMVEDHGYRSLRAASGKQAVDLAQSERPDVILLDLMMPGMSGWQTASALRERAGAGDVPIVILSVLSEAEAEGDRPEGEIVDWLEKPLGERALFAALEKALHRENPFSRVLVVEDDRDLASVLRAMFERHGLETFHAETGAEAIELSQRVSPDLLVLDVGLRDSDGYEVVAWLRRHERLHVMPLVVYTARDLDSDDRARLELGGRTEFITKSRVSPDQLERRVRRVLEDIAGERMGVTNGAQARAGDR